MGYTSLPLGNGFLMAICRAPLIAGPVFVLLALAAFGNPLVVEECPPALVAFDFNNGYTSTEGAAVILERYGYSGTVYEPICYIGTPGYLSMAQLSALYDKGWEIGSQGMSNCELTET